MLDLDSYFERIHYAGPRSASLDTLRELQRLHPLSIPFENLDTLAGRPVRLDAASLDAKLIHGRRGGYCFEQNLLFKHALGALKFDGRRYVCDVGFGGLTPTAPIELIPGIEQPTPHETFRVVQAGSEFAIEAHVRGQWKRLYRFDLQEQQQVDIELLNHYVMSHADSPMRSRLLAARVAPDRRFGLGNGVLNIHHVHGASEQQRIGSVAELKRVLESTFGVEVPAGAEVDAALARVLA
jgi:N-hydroxyarylamine O-acetyltransferase